MRLQLFVGKAARNPLPGLYPNVGNNGFMLGLQQVLAEMSLRPRIDRLKDLGEMLSKKT